MPTEMAASIPWDAWVDAFRRASPHNATWVHLARFDVKRFNPRRTRPGRLAALEEALYSDESWVEVPYSESDEEFQDMRAFAASTEAGKASRDLIFALAESKPFRAFRTTMSLPKYERVARRWDQNRRDEAERRLYWFCRAYDLPVDHLRFKELAVLLGESRSLIR